MLIDDPRFKEERIGVLVSKPFWHRALKADCVEISCTTFQLSTDSFVAWSRVTATGDVARRMQKMVLDKIDECIAHLQHYRELVIAQPLPERETSGDLP